MSAKREQRKREILREAKRLFNEKGFVNTSMSDLGAAVNLRDGSLYHYFPDKHAIAVACHQEALRVSIRCINNGRKYEGNGWQKLSHLIVCFFLEAGQNGPNIYAGDLTYLNEPDRARIRADRDHFIEQIATFIRLGISDGSMRVSDVMVSSEAVCSILFWLPKWSAEQKSRGERFAASILDAIAALLGAQPIADSQTRNSQSS